MSVDFQELRELLSAIAQTDITEFTLKSDDFELTLRKDSVVQTSNANVVIQEALPPAAVATQTKTNVESARRPII